MSPRSVTIVVLSYNRPALLAKALISIAQQTHPSFDVIVVDNASAASDHVRKVVAGFPGVRLIANETNLGFTGGMNAGLAAASGEFVYLTEDDVELDQHCVALLVDYLARNEQVALAGPVMWNKRTPTIRCAGGSFSLGGVYRMNVTDQGETTVSQSVPYSTMYIPGAMIGARTATLRELQGFRSDFFMYAEDVELCARVLERGWKIAIVPAARVYHHDPPDVPEPSLIRFHKQKNLAALYLLHAPVKVLPEFLARYLVVDGMRRLIRQRRTLPTWLAAWGAALALTPRLVVDRWRRPCAF